MIKNNYMKIAIQNTISEISVLASPDWDYDTNSKYWHIEVSVFEDGMYNSHLSENLKNEIDWEMFLEVELGVEYLSEFGYSLVDDEVYFEGDLQTIFHYRLGR